MHTHQAHRGDDDGQSSCRKQLQGRCRAAKFQCHTWTMVTMITTTRQDQRHRQHLPSQCKVCRLPLVPSPTVLTSTSAPPPAVSQRPYHPQLLAPTLRVDAHLPVVCTIPSHHPQHQPSVPSSATNTSTSTSTNNTHHLCTPSLLLPYSSQCQVCCFLFLPLPHNNMMHLSHSNTRLSLGSSSLHISAISVISDTSTSQSQCPIIARQHHPVPQPF